MLSPLPEGHEALPASVGDLALVAFHLFPQVGWTVANAVSEIDQADLAADDECAEGGEGDDLTSC